MLEWSVPLEPQSRTIFIAEFWSHKYKPCPECDIDVCRNTDARRSVEHCDAFA
jgi:hypothetical protein